MDQIDLQILKLLQENGRISNSEIGRKLDMVPSAILERIRKLEEQGHITGFHAQVNPSSLNLNFLAFVFVRVNGELWHDESTQKLAELPEVLEVHHVAGEDCYLLKVRVANPQDLANFMRTKMRAINPQASSRSIIVLETIKETSILPLERDSQ
ncbi:MAG: Lrp/AsnC family transcriptional regulator [Calditrichia bacterium]